jgi:hypothetical protein
LARASAFQAEGRGFESRLPLHFFPTRTWLRQDSGDGQGGWRPLHAIWSLPELGCAKIQVTGKGLRPLHAIWSLPELGCAKIQVTGKELRPLHAIWSLPELGCAKIQVTGKELRPLHPRSSAILLLLVILSLREFTSTCDFVLTAALLLPEYSLMRWCHK